MRYFLPVGPALAQTDQSCQIVPCRVMAKTLMHKAMVP